MDCADEQHTRALGEGSGCGANPDHVPNNRNRSVTMLLKERGFAFADGDEGVAHPCICECRPHGGVEIERFAADHRLLRLPQRRDRLGIQDDQRTLLFV
jgi:hypothetical protein